MPRFSILILTIGIPGCGKTTWVQEYLKLHPYAHVISTDDIRKELTGVEQCIDPSQNDMIHNTARSRAKSIIDNPDNYGGNNGLGPEIIIDSTNCDVGEWLEYKRIGASVMLAKTFDIAPNIAMLHQVNRERKVPLNILEMKWEQYQKNKKFIPCLFNMVL